MTLDTATVAIILNLLSTAGLLFGGLARAIRIEFKTNTMWAGYDELKQRVNTIWEFTYRRGQVELLQKGWGDRNSPIRLRVDGFDKIQPLLTQLIPAYIKWVAANPKITDGEVAELFERHFGDFIMEHLCIPQGLTEAACLTAIILACKIDQPPGESTHA